MKLKNILILFFIAPPLIIWTLMAPLVVRFDGLGQTMRSIGQILGLSGISLFCLVFLLKTRVRWLDNIFSGMDKAYIRHHNIGATAFILLLFHPLALAVRFMLQSTRAAALFLVPSFSQLNILYGQIGLGIMIILLVITFFTKIKYNIWKFSHKFLVVAFAFGFIHMITVSSDVSSNYLLRYYLVFLAFISVISIIYSKYFLKYYKYEVFGKRRLNKDVVEIILKPLGEPMKHLPGQFAFFKFYNSRIGDEEHPFSIASDPKDDNLKIIVKNLGDYTKNMEEIEVGTKVSVEGPFGRFLTNMAKDCIWIVGGIGITPFLGKINSIGENERIKLIYSVNNANEAIYDKELSLISSEKFVYHLWMSQDKGYLTAEKIKEMYPDFLKSDFYFCGPSQMIDSIKSQLLTLGVKKSKMHSEAFNLL